MNPFMMLVICTAMQAPQDASPPVEDIAIPETEVARVDSMIEEDLLDGLVIDEEPKYGKHI